MPVIRQKTYTTRVTIQKTLLRAFLLIGLVPAMLLAALAFFTVRAAMQDEIEHGLVTQADAVVSDINKIMFERLQNAATWSTLESMQDLQVRDVDKRLSNFLSKLNMGYGGVYHRLYAVNREGRIISSSNPADIGNQTPAPVSAWQTIRLAGATLILEPPQRKPGAGSSSSSITTVTIRTPVLSQFNGEMLGDLVLDMDWGQINTLLDHAATGQRSMVLADSSGAVFAASRALRHAGPLSGVDKAGTKITTMPLSKWQLHKNQSSAFIRSGTAVFGADFEGNVVVGSGHASGFAGYPGTGLIALVIQPESDALLPIHRMAFASFLLLAGLVLFTLVVANKVSGTIAHPIVALTNWTRYHAPATRQPSFDGASSPHSGITGLTRVTELTAQVYASEVNEVGELACAFTQLMQDIEQAQQHLVRASKLAVVGEMASVIIHEVRTPLGIIRSSAQMLRREPGLSDEGREFTGFIESETERLNRLVSSMLDSARPRPLNKAPVNLHTLIHHSSELLAAQLEQRQISITEQLQANNPWVDCDAGQLTQVLLNLIMNALQILTPGGKIRLATHEHADTFVIEIADNGPGIAPEQRPRLFDAFFCLREGGVGLGLAIVQQIILAHGGEISVGASETGGALFSIRLPRTASTRTESTV